MKTRKINLIIAIAIPLLLLNSGIALASNTDWWNSDWQYRRSITISNTENPNDLVDYQVKIVVPYSSGMQSNFSDLRFTYKSGTEKEIPYWLEDYTTSTNATVWLKIPLLPKTSNTTIWLYYGNALASSESNGSEVFEFWDDFNTNTLSNYDIGLKTVSSWGATINPTYDSTNKRVNINNGDNIETTLSPKNLNLSNVYSEALFHIDGGYPAGAVAMIAEKWQDADNHYDGSKSGNEYSNTGGGGTACTYVSPHIEKIIAGTGTSLAPPATNSYITLGTEEKIGLGIADNTLKLFVNDELVLQTTDSSITTSGRIIFSGKQYNGWVDNIRIRKYSSIEPSYSIGPEQSRNFYLTLSTDSASYSLGDIIYLNLVINRTSAFPQVAKFSLELEDLDGIPDNIIETASFIMPSKFYKNVTLKYTIPNSPFVSSGRYAFRADLIDPNFNTVLVSDVTYFEISDA
ncbi:MAG: DUF2341 domain-containing protein, partial [Methanosarcinales archaeon]